MLLFSSDRFRFIRLWPWNRYFGANSSVSIRKVSALEHLCYRPFSQYTLLEWLVLVFMTDLPLLLHFKRKCRHINFLSIDLTMQGMRYLSSLSKWSFVGYVICALDSSFSHIASSWNVIVESHSYRASLISNFVSYRSLNIYRHQRYLRFYWRSE